MMTSKEDLETGQCSEAGCQFQSKTHCPSCQRLLCLAHSTQFPREVNVTGLDCSICQKSRSLENQKLINAKMCGLAIVVSLLFILICVILSI